MLQRARTVGCISKPLNSLRSNFDPTVTKTVRLSVLRGPGYEGELPKKLTVVTAKGRPGSREAPDEAPADVTAK